MSGKDCEKCEDKERCDELTKEAGACLPKDVLTVAEHHELMSHATGMWVCRHRSQAVEMVQRLIDTKEGTPAQRANALALIIYYNSKEVHLPTLAKPKPAPTTETSEYNYTHKSGLNLNQSCNILDEVDDVKKRVYMNKTLPIVGQNPTQVGIAILELMEDTGISSKLLALYVTHKIDILNNGPSPELMRLLTEAEGHA